MDGSASPGQVIEVEVLGPVGARVGGRQLDVGGPRQQVLLAILAQHVGRVVSTDALVDVVWDGDPPDAAERTFRTYVARLRKALNASGAVPVDGTTLVAIHQHGYRLDGTHVVVDADRFAALLDRAREQLTAGEAAVAVGLLDEALGLWRGRAYGPFADRSWARPEAVRLEELHVVARELRLQALLDAGRVDDAIAGADALSADHPHRESSARVRALARYRAGRHADALAVVRGYREQLAQDTGLDASSRFDELEHMILAQDPRLDRPVGGRRLRGYVLHEVVGETSLGAVHRAEQRSTGREVAITVLPAGRADDPNVVRAFEARAQQVAAVEHPHVVPVYDYWREPGGAYVVTRFPAGGTLDRRLRAGSITPDGVARIVRQVGGALAAAHDRGVVHGAIDTRAVLLDERGDAFLAAFEPVDPRSAADDLVGLADLVDVLVANAGAGAGSTHVLSRLREVAAVARDVADDRVATVAGLVEVVQTMLGVDRPSTAVTQLVAGPNPYRGLAAFRETDADVFFGRDRLVVEVLGRLARQTFVAVSGPSGSGKSSVVRAGVLPRLRAEGAFVTTMIPGATPLDELVVALSRIATVPLDPDMSDRLAVGDARLADVLRGSLPDPDGDAVLVVDQFEELFTDAPVGEREAFLRVLAAAIDHPERRFRVIATVRADFLGQVLDDPDAGPLVHERTVLARPLTADELHEIVVGPAEVAGVAVEPALATAIVADAARSPGSLPMVQFALTEAFEAAIDGTMTLADYRRLGGIEGVLGQRAEEVYAALDTDGRAAAKALFGRLVRPNDGAPPTRRRALGSELVALPDRVLEAFGSARLLRFDRDEESREPTVEVAHEALFNAWPRLAAWVEEEVDDLRLLGRLTANAYEWDAGGRTDTDVYRGSRLEAGLAYADRHRGELTPVEQAYLDAGRALRSSEAEWERRHVRRLRQLTSGLAVGLVVALVAGGLAWLARQQEAEARSAQEATAAAAQADALAYAATSTLGSDRELATLLAAEAWAASPDATSFGALVAVLGDDPRVRALTETPASSCVTAAPGGERVTLARTADDGSAIVDVRTPRLEPMRELSVPATQLGCPTVDPTGNLVVGDVATGRLVVADRTDGTILATHDGWTWNGLADVAIAPDGREAVYVRSDGMLVRLSLPGLDVNAEHPVVDITDGLPVFAVPTYGERGETVVVEHGGLVHVVASDGTTRSVGPLGLELTAPAVVAEAAGLLLVSAVDGLYAVDLEDDDVAPRPLPTQGTPVTESVVRADGAVAAVGTTAGIELIDLRTSRAAGPAVAVDAVAASVRWDAADRLLVAGPGSVVVVEPDHVVPVGALVEGVPVGGVGTWPASDGSGAITYDRATESFTWVDGLSGEQRDLDLGTWTSVAARPLGRWVVVDTLAGTVEVRSTGRLETSSRLPDEVVGVMRPQNVFLLLDGDHVALVLQTDGDAGAAAHSALALSLADGEVTAFVAYGVPGTGPVSARVLPDGGLVLGFGDGRVEVHARDGRVLDTSTGLDSVTSLAVAPDGRRIAVGGPDEVVVLDADLDGDGLRLPGMAVPVGRMWFVADNRLVTRHFDGATLLWDLSEGRLVGPLVQTEEYRYGMTPAEDGRSLVHMVRGGIAEIPLDPAAWLAEACRLVSRSLTQAELEAVAPGRERLEPCASPR